jgi:voltage-gated potassium channel Kch
MTTVGYGDLSPETSAGKLLAVFVMLVGIGAVTILTGAVAQHFLITELEEETAEAGGGEGDRDDRHPQ